MSKVTNLAFIRAQPGRSGELGRRLRRLVVPSRREPGCISYDLHRADNDPDLWMVYENWRSTDDLQAHLATAHMRAFIAERSEEHTSELQSLMRISYAVFCLKKKQNTYRHTY